MLRAAAVLFFGGAAADRMSEMYKGLPRSERSKQPFHFQHHRSETVPHRWYGEVQKDTYKSPPINLMNGEAWFTLPDVNRMPFPKPGKKYAVIDMVADVVTEDGRRPPTSEMNPFPPFEREQWIPRS